MYSIMVLVRRFSLDGCGVEHDMHGLTGLIVVVRFPIHSDTKDRGDLRHREPISRLLM